MTVQEIMERVVFLLSAGISVESLTKSIIFSGFVEGAFSPDVGLLFVPRVSKMIFTLGEGAGLKKIKINPPRRNKTKDLINIIDNNNFNKVPGGDNNTSWGYLVPINKLIDFNNYALR